MNSFSVLAYCQSNLPSLHDIPSYFPQKRKNSTSTSTDGTKNIAHPQGILNSVSIAASAVCAKRSSQLNNDITNIRASQKRPLHRKSTMTSSLSSASPPMVPRNVIRRNNSTPTVNTITPNGVSGRVSMDSYDRARYLRPTPADAMLSSSAPAKTSMPTKSRHKKSSSSPSFLLSPPLAPTSPSSTISSPATPSLTSLASIPAVVLESEVEVEPLDLLQSELPHSSFEEVPAPPPTPTPSMFFGRATSSTSSTPVATPPASPALRAASSNPSVSPSPSTTPPSSPSPSFLATWHGRLPSIPRPSPMMPFRAAKKVVTSVTSVGTGLLPSKEQLGSIPVAGRILKHPVMDSTLTYIASKTTHRGSKGASLESKVIPPEDAHYRKLNKKLVDQSITLSALAIEREEQSKTIDDEAGDDAFELYLAAIATLMHALPIETCEPLRREAFESQLRSFLNDNQLDSADEDADSKQLRRRRRRRHREHHDQATSLIHQYSLPSSDHSTSPQPQQGQQHRRRHDKAGRRSARRGRKNSDAYSTPGPTLGETIISTAVESAVRLKQSPIPDVIKTCFHASRVIFSKVDERFHLQEKAWQISKQSIEKAIELDEQYAIHEVMTETFFATVTGLVKAGIAYKETPSYATVRALTSKQQPPQEQIQGALPAPEPERFHNPQAILDSGRRVSLSSARRRYSIIAEEDEEISRRDHGLESSGENFDDSSSSCFSTSEDEDDDDDRNVEVEGRSGGASGRKSSLDQRRQSLLSTATSALPEQYQEQARQKIGLVMALRGAASLFLGSSIAK